MSSLRSFSATTYATRTNCVVTAPSGITNGDKLTLLFVILGGASPPSITLPSGFTTKSGYPHSTAGDPNNYIHLWLAEKTASGESGNYTITHGNASSQGLILCVQNAQDSINTFNTGVNTAEPYESTASGLTTPTDNALVAFLSQNWYLWGGASPPSGTTPTFTEQSDSANNLIYLATGVLASQGSTGNKTHGNLNQGNNAPWSAMLVSWGNAPFPTFFNSARNPADQGGYVAVPCAVTPPANMQEGDLVVLHAGARYSTVFDFSMSNAGGQTWDKAGEFDASANAKHAVFWCRFNGTWSANPSLTNGNSVAMWAEMAVFRPSDPNNIWAIDQAYAGANVSAPSSPYTYTRTGVTNVHDSTVTVATFQSQDDNTWGSLSGTGWTNYSPLYTRTSTNGSHAHAYYIGGSGATGNVSLNQLTLGGDAGLTSIVSFYEQSSVVDHTTTGSLAAQASAVVGAAQHKALHGCTGALSSQAATVAGTASSATARPSTGALSASAATITGTAARTRQHACTGSLSAQPATVTGTAARTRAHTTLGALVTAAAVVAGVASSATLRPSTGALSAQSATVAGTAARTSGAVEHATEGALSAQPATVAGTAARTRAHPATGVLSAQPATVAGAASSATARPSTGALTAQPATVAGTAARTRTHTGTGALLAQPATVAGAASSATARPSTGALTAQSAVVAGQAMRGTGAVTHGTAGDLAAQFATVAGTAARTRAHPATGALSAQPALLAGIASSATTRPSSGSLVAQAASVAGTASSATPRPSTGLLQAQSAAVAGTAARTRAHSTTGTLSAQPAVVAGTAARTRVHPTTGGLASGNATLLGTASSATQRPSTGALVAQAASVSGVASRLTTEVLRLTWAQLQVPSTADADKLKLTWTQLSVPPAEYNTWTAAGALSAGAAQVAGEASSATPRPSTGVLAAGAAHVTGTARRYREHVGEGALTAGAAHVTGTARRYRTHATQGGMAGQPGQIAGAALSYTIHNTVGAPAARRASISGSSTIVTFHFTTGELKAQAADVSAVSLRLYQGRFTESPYWFPAPIEPDDGEVVKGLRKIQIPAENRQLLVPAEEIIETPRLMLVMPEQRKLTVAIQADRPSETP